MTKWKHNLIGISISISISLSIITFLCWRLRKLCRDCRLNCVPLKRAPVLIARRAPPALTFDPSRKLAVARSAAQARSLFAFYLFSLKLLIAIDELGPIRRARHDDGAPLMLHCLTAFNIYITARRVASAS